MPKLHEVLRDLVGSFRNNPKGLLKAYKLNKHLFQADPAYFYPYEAFFEIIGSKVKLEDDYFKHALIPKVEDIAEDITPLQAASIIIKMFNQESFFMLHEYSLLAYVQSKETSSTAEKKSSEGKNEISLSKIFATLGVVNWVTRFDSFFKRFNEVVAEISSEEKVELVEIVQFIGAVAKATMEYATSLVVFQEMHHRFNQMEQILFEITIKETDLNICQRKLQVTADLLNLNPTDPLLEQDAYLLPQKIAELETAIEELKKKLPNEEKNRQILNDLRNHREALNELRTSAKNLDAKIREKTQEKLPERSSSLAWKRAIQANNVEYLKQLFKLGVSIKEVGDYFFANSNPNATFKKDMLSREMIDCIIEAGYALSDEQKSSVIVLGEEGRMKKVPANRQPTVKSMTPDMVAEYSEEYAEEYYGGEYAEEYGEEYYGEEYAEEYMEEYAEEYVEEHAEVISPPAKNDNALKEKFADKSETEVRVKATASKSPYSRDTTRNVNVSELAAKFGGFNKPKQGSTSKSDEPSYSPKPSK